VRTILCRGGRQVEVIDEDHWWTPSWHGTLKERVQIDFTDVPTEVRPWWRAVMEVSYRHDSVAQAYNIWATARWFCRYLDEQGTVSMELDAFEMTNWGSYAQWLDQQVHGKGKPLSFDYRRGQFLWLASAAKHAIAVGLPGVSPTTIDRLQRVSRRAFRGGAAVVRERIQHRALTAAQVDDLYRMMAEEWQRYLDARDGTTVATDLQALVACWLAFNDGIRSAEINYLTVEDVEADGTGGKHSLHVHAPNKDADVLPIDKDTLTMLQALIDEGAKIREELGTTLLFVDRTDHPYIVTTRHLNKRVRFMVARHDVASLPPDLKLPDGRTTLGTALAHGGASRETARRVLRHRWASTTETYYRAEQKVATAGRMARALQAETLRLTIACQRPVLDVAERPDQVDILARNPDNEFEWGNCGLDIERQGACRMATHCWYCPLLVVWASKRENFVHEQEQYLRLAEEAQDPRTRENRLYHANQAAAYIYLIDRRRAEEAPHAQQPVQIRVRRPRRPAQPALGE